VETVARGVTRPRTDTSRAATLKSPIVSITYTNGWTSVRRDDQNFSLITGDDHDCNFRREADALRVEMAELREQFAALQKHLFGMKSEKMPPMRNEVQKERPRDPEQAKELRRKNSAARDKLDTEVVTVPVPESARSCTACGTGAFKTVGNGTPSVVYDYVAPHFRRRIYRRETVACRCGSSIVTAPCPEKVFDRSQYTPSFVAYLIVAKCADAIPLYRLEKQFARVGVPVARSTMTDLFHRAAELLAPLSERIIERIGRSPIVSADETPIKMQSSTKRAFIWTFLGEQLVGYVFSTGRSGDTPARVLGDSTGELVADLYTGYNKVTEPGRRNRAGCLAHARRKIFDAKENSDALPALELIRDIYVVEHDAATLGIVGTEAHLALRRERSRPLFARLLLWARATTRRHSPKSLMSKAAGYLLRGRKPLSRFLHLAALPPDNNRSEAALRRVALGRKNYLFVGNEDAGKNVAGLYSLVASCELNGINPTAYLTDVMAKLSVESDIDALLPDRWRPSPDG
jgi:transposase